MAQTPTKYELAINSKKALGLEMLAQVARRANSNKRTDVTCWPLTTGTHDLVGDCPFRGAPDMRR